METKLSKKKRKNPLQIFERDSIIRYGQGVKTGPWQKPRPLLQGKWEFMQLHHKIYQNAQIGRIDRNFRKKPFTTGLKFAIIGA